MQIFIHRNNEDFGPYSKEAVLEYLKQGVFQACDYACYRGMSEWKTINDLLGIAPAPAKPGRGGNMANSPAGASLRAGARTTGSIAMPAPASMRRAPAPREKRTGIIFLNVILAALVCGGIYLRMGGGGEAGRQLMASIRGAILGGQTAATPAPEPAPVASFQANPLPVQPAVPVAVIATPTPPPLPATVRITVPVKFPAMMDGKVVGSVSVPQGTEVALVKADGDQLIINYQGGMVRIARNLTNLDSALPAAPASSLPAATPAPPATVSPHTAASTPGGTPDPTDPDASLGAGGN